MFSVPERKVAVLAVVVEVEPPETREREESGFGDVVAREDEIRIRVTGSGLVLVGRTHFRFGLSGRCTFPD